MCVCACACADPPVSGTSVGLIMRLICSIDCRSGERPATENGVTAVRSGVDDALNVTQTSVTAEDLLVHDGGDGQAVETVGKRLPQFDVEPAFTCVKENRS